MNPTADNTEFAVLVVTDDDAVQGPLAELCRGIATAGCRLDYVADVFTATARLANQTPYLRVIADVRLWTDEEIDFVYKARRYFPDSPVVVPRLPGTVERLADGNERICPVPVQAIVNAIRSITAATNAASASSGNAGAFAACDLPAQEDGAFAMIDDALESMAGEADMEDRESAVEPVAFDQPAEGSPAPRPHHRPALSTDVAGPTGDHGASLHGAVRERMAQAAASRVERLPPQRRAPANASQALADDSALSHEEIDALLAQEHAAGSGRADASPPDDDHGR